MNEALLIFEIILSAIYIKFLNNNLLDKNDFSSRKNFRTEQTVSNVFVVTIFVVFLLFASIIKVHFYKSSSLGNTLAIFDFFLLFSEFFAYRFGFINPTLFHASQSLFINNLIVVSGGFIIFAISFYFIKNHFVSTNNVDASTLV